MNALHKGHVELLEQLKKTRYRGIVVGRDNLVASAHVFLHDQAEIWRDVHGMLRIRQRANAPPMELISVERSLPAAPIG